MNMYMPEIADEETVEAGPSTIHQDGNTPEVIQSFVFPQPPVGTSEDAPVERTPRLTDTKTLPVSSSDVSLPLNLQMEPDGSLSKSSLLTSITGYDSRKESRSGTLETMSDSIGTILSLAPSSLAQEPQEGLSAHQGETKQRSKHKKLSGLSLSKPTSSGSGSSSSDSSRSSSADSRNPGASRASSALRMAQVEEGTPTATPLATPKAFLQPVSLPAERHTSTFRSTEDVQNRVRWSSPPRSDLDRESARAVDERTPLLGSTPDDRLQAVYVNGPEYDEERGASANENGEFGVVASFRKPFFTASSLKRFRFSKAELRQRAMSEVRQVPVYTGMAVKAIPSVLLGCLLNILDGVSCESHLFETPFAKRNDIYLDGMIIFPATGVFTDLGPMGVSMFFVSAVIAQLVYTLGGSGFAGANGSMMIEVVVR